MLDDPRPIDQAKQLFSLLGVSAVDAAATIEVPAADVIQRLSARRVCVACGRNYQVAQTSQLNEWTWASRGGQVVQRHDDAEPFIPRRLAVYEKTAARLLQWFTNEHRLVVVNGVGNPDQELARSSTRPAPRTRTPSECAFGVRVGVRRYPARAPT